MEVKDIMFLKLLYARYNKVTQKDFLGLINRRTDRIEVCFNDGQIEIKYYNNGEYSGSMLIDNKTNIKNGVIELRPHKSEYSKFLKLLKKYNKNFFKVDKIDYIEIWHEYATIHTRDGNRIELQINEPKKFKIMKVVEKN